MKTDRLLYEKTLVCIGFTLELFIFHFETLFQPANNLSLNITRKSRVGKIIIIELTCFDIWSGSCIG